VGIRTVRTAMDLLEREGLVRREAWRGVFIRQAPPRSTPSPAKAIKSVTLVGMSLHDGNPFPINDWLAAHSNALERRGIRMRYVIYWGHEDWVAEELVNKGAAGGEGCILLGNAHAGLVRDLVSHGVPCVVQCYARYSLEGMVPHPRVFVNKYKGACDAVEYLAGLGHRRIGFLGGTPAGPYGGPGLQIYEGYCAALLRLGLEPRQEETAHVHTQEPEVAMAQARTILDKAPRPTALLCGNDAAAVGAIRAAEAMGLRVPQDLSVMGFDNASWLDPAKVPLTTVSIPRRLLSESAVELLLDVVAGKAAADESRVLECDLVVRGTTAPPAAS